jgi:cytochrome P450
MNPEEEPVTLVTERRDQKCPFAPSGQLVEFREQPQLPRIPVRAPWHGEYEALAVTRYADVRRILGDQRFPMGFGYDPDAPRSMTNQPGFLLSLDGPDHAHVRRMLTGVFGARSIERMRPTVERIVTEHLDAMAESGPVGDVVRDFAIPVTSQVMCEVLGIPVADRVEFERRTEQILDLTGGPQDQIEISARMRDYMAELIGAKRTAPDESLLSRLVNDPESGLTQEELLGVGNIVLIAGHDVSANMIGLSAFALLLNPDQLALVRDDESVVSSAVDELLRYLSVAPSMPRRASEDTVIGEHHVKAGQALLISLVAANWDPALVGAETHLDIRREPVPHMAFGYGVHQCLGQHLARLELRIALPRLLRHFPNLRLAVPEEEIVFRPNSPVYGLESLPVAW